MADVPILFSGPMVLALLAGRKTQTRRVLKLPTKSRGLPIYERPDMGGWEASTIGGPGVFTIGKDGERIPEPERACVWHRTVGAVVAPAIKVGDRLWVREAWRTESRAYDDLAPSDMGGEETIIFEADADWSKNKTVGRRRAGMHMPRWASRISLIVSEVRVQRLQDISGADAEAEGVFKHVAVHSLDKVFRDERAATAIAYYQQLWDNLNAERGFAWKTNPLVSVITFEIETEIKP